MRQCGNGKLLAAGSTKPAQPQLTAVPFGSSQFAHGSALCWCRLQQRTAPLALTLILYTVHPNKIRSTNRCSTWPCYTPLRGGVLPLCSHPLHLQHRCRTAAALLLAPQSPATPSRPPSNPVSFNLRSISVELVAHCDVLLAGDRGELRRLSPHLGEIVSK